MLNSKQSSDRFFFRRNAKLIREQLTNVEKVLFDQMCHDIRVKLKDQHQQVRAMCVKNKNTYIQEVYSGQFKNLERLFGIYWQKFFKIQYQKERELYYEVKRKYEKEKLCPVCNYVICNCNYTCTACNNSFRECSC